MDGVSVKYSPCRLNRRQPGEMGAAHTVGDYWLSESVSDRARVNGRVVGCPRTVVALFLAPGASVLASGLGGCRTSRRFRRCRTNLAMKLERDSRGQRRGLDGREMLMNELQDGREELARPDPARFAQKVLDGLDLPLIGAVDDALQNVVGHHESVAHHQVRRTTELFHSRLNAKLVQVPLQCAMGVGDFVLLDLRAWENGFGVDMQTSAGDVHEGLGLTVGASAADRRLVVNAAEATSWKIRTAVLRIRDFM